MKTLGRGLSVLAFAWTLSTTGTARADVPNDDPCDGKESGDACETLNGEAGTCDAELNCVVDEGGCSVSSVGTRAAAGSLVAFTLAALAFARLAKRRRAAG